VVARRCGRWLGVFLISTCTGCLLYTDSVNVAPTVTIIAPDSITRGTSLTFRADAHDDQSAPLDYSWRLTEGACPPGGALPDGTPIASGTQPTFTVTLTGTANDYCVAVSVADQFRASAASTATLHVEDQPPVAAITEVGTALIGATPSVPPVPLWSALRFTAALSFDPDPADVLAFSWTLASPGGGAPATPPACADAPDDVCLTVNQPGQYTLALTARDPAGATGSQSLSFTVAPDQAPCIADTAPPFLMAQLVRNPADDLTFTVNRVNDDGDPLPPPADRPSMLSFSWSWRIGSTDPFTRMADYDLPTFLFPGGSFQSGQTLQVRVEAHDRRPQQPELDACYAQSPLPALCEVRAGCDQWVTWTVDLR
jgi:hypothetical protein